MNPEQLLVTDIDGVLINSKAAVLNAYQAAFLRHGIRLSESQFDRMIWGHDWKAAKANLREDAVFDYLSDTDLDNIREYKNKIFNEAPILVSDIACALVSSLSLSMQVILATGGSRAATQHKIDQLVKQKGNGWSEYFVVCEVNKHEHQFWLDLCSRLGFHPRNLVVIDDDPDVITCIKQVGGKGLLWTEFS